MKTIFFSILLLCIGCKGKSQEKPTKEHTAFEVQKTDAEWRAELTDLQYYVLRKAGTEPAWSSELLENKKQGVYVCAGCNTELFKSDHKYDSRSGWPSFDREIKGNVAFDEDYTLGMQRIEEHCAVCGGHLGHVFNDGPRNTTGKRHCINGAALKFIPSAQ